MTDPFTAWSRLIGAAMNVARTGMKTGETITASFDVVAARSEMIGTAMHSPMTADHAELAQMVPEKVAAFSAAGQAVAGQLWAMQVAMMAEAEHLGAMAMRGRPPTPAEWGALSTRNAEFMLGSIERGSALAASALAPIHKRATANARRLRGSKRKPA